MEKYGDFNSTNPHSDLKLLGQDNNGFRYYSAPDNYVYQQYPNSDYWVNGENRKDHFNGWFCSGPAWERTMHKILKG